MISKGFCGKVADKKQKLRNKYVLIALLESKLMVMRPLQQPKLLRMQVNPMLAN